MAGSGSNATDGQAPGQPHRKPRGLEQGSNLRTALVLALIAAVFFGGVIINRIIHG